MNREMQIIVEVDNQAEIFYKDAEELGNHAATVLKRSRAQLTGLETIAESTSKTSDIFDYIKRQIARNFSWRQTSKDSPNEGFGMRLKKYLETDLKSKVGEICGSNKLNIGENSDEEQRERRRIHLLLMRQFIRQMVIQYEFQVNIGDLNPQSKQGSNQKNQGNNKKGQ